MVKCLSESEDDHVIEEVNNPGEEGSWLGSGPNTHTGEVEMKQSYRDTIPGL